MTMGSDILFSLFAVSILIIMICMFVIAMTSIYLRKKRQHAQEKQRLHQEFEQTMVQSQLEIQEQTLQHVSRELHDNIGQIAGLVKLNLETMKLLEQEDAKERLNETTLLSKQLIGDIKQLSISLSGDKVAQEGIVDALKKEVEHINKLGILDLGIESEEVHFSLTRKRSVILYRMCQELLHNALKHSQASEIWIRLKSNDRDLIVEIIDNGVGFESEKIQSNGLGLNNLYSRAKMLDGNICFDSAPNNGTKVRIKLPLDL